tara:strand:+ start:1189 stop:1701 length:513 start_codon:yes stop_codon:yes gene_type:complete
MTKYKKIYYLFLTIFFSMTLISNADQNIKFINMDKIVKETNIGNQMLNNIDKLDKQNVEKLNSFETQIKNDENQLKLKKNIISDEEFEKELSLLKAKLDKYTKEKNLMVKKLNDFKKDELKNFFDKINPIIQNYLDQNSIDMLLNSKNIYMGNKNSDLTKQIIDEINKKL